VYNEPSLLHSLSSSADVISFDSPNTRRIAFDKKIPVFVIDDPTTVVCDDGISLETMADGTEWIHVHITDVERFLPMGKSAPIDPLDCGLISFL
jgi:exoribonuclease R